MGAEAGDADALERTAHRLKGTALIFRSEPVAGRALRLEEMGRIGSVAGAVALAGELQQEVERLTAWLAEVADGL